MSAWKSNSELRLFKRMLYAFSFMMLSCMICGVDAMSGVMPTSFNIVIVLLGDLAMLLWIFLVFPDARIDRNRIIINAIARITGAIGIIIIIFASISPSHFFQKFIYLAALPYLLVSVLSWCLLYLYRKA
ncbi:hypothetical protein IJ913_01255 [bacterium]|nr:hypothetical protein [bacterium]